MEYTVTISTKEFQTLVVEHTCMDIENRRLHERLTEESWKYYKALGELKDAKEELEKIRRELEAATGSSDFWYKKACELGYGKENEEAE